MKSYKEIKTLAASLIVSIVFTTGCYYDKVIPAGAPEGDISYSEDMQPLFDASCIACHNGGGIPLNLKPSVSYAELIFGDYIDKSNPKNSILYKEINTGGDMEQYATDTERAMTLKWIEQGAQNN